MVSKPYEKFSWRERWFKYYNYNNNFIVLPCYFRLQIMHLSLSIITLHMIIEITISTNNTVQSSMEISDGTERNTDFSRENTSGKSPNAMKGGSDEEEDADHQKNHEHKMITSTPTPKYARSKRSGSNSDNRQMKHVKKKRIKNARHHGYRVLYAKDVVSSNADYRL